MSKTSSKLLIAIFDAPEAIQNIRQLVAGEEINDYNPSTGAVLDSVMKHYNLQEKELALGSPGEALEAAIVSRIATQHV